VFYRVVNVVFGGLVGWDVCSDNERGVPLCIVSKVFVVHGRWKEKLVVRREYNVSGDVFTFFDGFPGAKVGPGGY
jgi:hypothetical protein